ncbi:MAG: efflux RND transporter periplasmic adaptor subunit [Steroidobacteraceae bacterium]
MLVRTMPLQQGHLPRTVSAYGVVQAEPGAQNSVVAPIAAQVGQVYVRSGQAVGRGAALVQLLPSAPTRAAYTQAVSALKVATEDTLHTRQLLSQHLATQQQLAAAEKVEGDASAALEALRSQGAGGPRTLRAPFDAIVTGVTATVQSLVSEGTTLLDIARPNGLVLAIGVAPAAAGSVAAGNRVRVTPVGDSMSYAGTVIDRGSIVQSDGLVPVQIALPLHKFLPGESAQATVTVGKVSGYVVPHAAVLIDDNGNSYVVQAVNAVAKLVYVQVLDTQDDREVISGPLDIHAPLVLTGNYQAQNGMKLRLAPGNGPGSASASAAGSEPPAGAASVVDPAKPAAR